MIRLDHVVYAVGDLDAAADRFRSEFGLDSASGGRHALWGTANRIVPLGGDYIELIAVDEPDKARASAFGQSVMEAADRGGAPITICAATDRLASIVLRLDLTVHSGTRERPDGVVLRWRSAGLEDERREPWMPFFIEWDIQSGQHPGRTWVGHAVRVNGIAWVEVSGDEDRLLEWLGGEELPIRFVPGPPGIRAVAIATSDGELIVS